MYKVILYISKFRLLKLLEFFDAAHHAKPLGHVDSSSRYRSDKEVQTCAQDRYIHPKESESPEAQSV